MNNIASAFDIADDQYFSDLKRCEVIEDIYENFKVMHEAQDWSSLRYLPSGRYLSEETARINDGSHQDMVAAINCVLANGDSSSFDF